MPAPTSDWSTYPYASSAGPSPASSWLALHLHIYSQHLLAREGSFLTWLSSSHKLELQQVSHQTQVHLWEAGDWDKVTNANLKSLAMHLGALVHAYCQTLPLSLLTAPHPPIHSLLVSFQPLSGQHFIFSHAIHFSSPSLNLPSLFSHTSDSAFASLPTCVLPDKIYISGIGFHKRFLFPLGSLPHTNWSISRFPTKLKFSFGMLVIEMKSTRPISKV